MKHSLLVTTLALTVGTLGCGKSPGAKAKDSAPPPVGTASLSKAIVLDDMTIQSGQVRKVSVSAATANGAPKAAAASSYDYYYSMPWAKATIPVEFGAGISAEKQRAFYDACLEWTRLAGVRCVPRQGEANYLGVVTNTDPINSGVCNSHVGMSRTPSRMQMHLGTNCWGRSVILHEQGHALGLMHEHQRPDRDDWLLIHWDNIQPDYRFAYDKIGTAILRSGYDYFSIMHYRNNAFSRGGNTFSGIKLPSGRFDSEIGMQAELTASDGQTVRAMYDAWLKGTPAAISITPDQNDELQRAGYLRIAELSAKLQQMTGVAAPDPAYYGYYPQIVSNEILSGYEWINLLKSAGLVVVTVPPVAPVVSISGINPRGPLASAPNAAIYFELYGKFPHYSSGSVVGAVTCDGSALTTYVTYVSTSQVNVAFAPSPNDRACTFSVKTDQGSSLPFALAVVGQRATAPRVDRTVSLGLFYERYFFDVFGDFPLASGNSRSFSVDCEGIHVDQQLGYDSREQLTISLGEADSAGRTCTLTVSGGGGPSQPYTFTVPGSRVTKPRLDRLDPLGLYYGRYFFDLFGNFPDSGNAPRGFQVLCDGIRVEQLIGYSSQDQLTVSLEAGQARGKWCAFAVTGLGNKSEVLWSHID